MLRTRVVRLLRVVLPLAALALLSVLFLLGRKSETVEPAIPYAQGSAEDLGRIIGRAEEIMELGVAIMLMQALVVFLRDRSPNAKQGAPAGRPAATGPSARYH